MENIKSIHSFTGTNKFDRFSHHGVGKAIKDIDIDDDAFKGIEAIIYSMTPEERAHPGLLNGQRRKRIAKGSGTTVQDVNKLITQFDQARKMMKTVQAMGSNPKQMARMRRK